MVQHKPYTLPHTRLPLRTTWRLPRVRSLPSTLGGVFTRPASLLCSLLFIWFVWFYRFIEFAARIKREKPGRPDCLLPHLCLWPAERQTLLDSCHTLFTP